jgi:hypothetical protein
LYILKGFARISALRDNNEGVVAPLGELSPRGYTYAKNKTVHNLSDPEHQGVQLVAMTSKEDVGNQYVVPHGDVANRTVEIISWMYKAAVRGDITSDPVQLQRVFLDHWGTDISLIVSGPMVGNGDIFLPEFITFRVEGRASNECTVWFSNNAFMTQYSDYEIVVVPTVKPMNVFLGTSAQVRAAANAVNPTIVQQDCDAAALGFPYTVQRSDMFEWTSIADRSDTVPIWWNTIIYGEAGNNLDAVKQAIIDYLLRNSTEDESVWKPLFPELFASTEFIILPLWHEVAIPNLTVQTGMYSSASDLSTIDLLCQRGVQGVDYTTEHINASRQLMSTSYKGLHCVIVGGPENIRGQTKFKSMYPDYTNLYTTHPDFGRMSLSTRQLIIRLVEMFMLAEGNMATIPVGFTRVVRNNVTYLSSSIERVQFLVAVRANNLMG